MPISTLSPQIATLGDVFMRCCRLIGGTAPAGRITRGDFAARYGTAGGIMFVSGRGRSARVFFSFETPHGPVKASAENGDGTRWTLEYPLPHRSTVVGQRITEAEAIAEVSRVAARIRAQEEVRRG
ncbi:MAG: hypothetical protein RLZZ373_3221 [Pseudomonadota bacterium]|jgi:hypothetical protein